MYLNVRILNFVNFAFPISSIGGLGGMAEKFAKSTVCWHLANFQNIYSN